MRKKGRKQLNLCLDEDLTEKLKNHPNKTRLITDLLRKHFDGFEQSKDEKLILVLERILEKLQ